MVDWMVEVMSSYSCADATFFLSVHLMDQFYKKLECSAEAQDVHVTGVACMFIASKLEEIYPIKLLTVYNKIGHQKISIQTLKLKESQILQVLDFQVQPSSIYEFVQVQLLSKAFSLVLNLEHQTTQVNFQLFIRAAINIAKMLLYDYEI